MKKLAISIAAIAVITFGFSGGAAAHFPGVCKKAAVVLPGEHAVCHALLDDADDAEPLTLGALCTAGVLTEDTKIQKTKEFAVIDGGNGEIGGNCSIDLADHDLSIRQATIEVVPDGDAGDLTIEDTGVGGLVAIIASDITVDGDLDIGPIDGDVTVTRNIAINVGTNLTIDTVGSVNVRNNLLTSGAFALTVSGDAGVSIKDNVLIGFNTVTISSTNGEVFVNGNDFGNAVVTITAAGGDCLLKDNINTNAPDPTCPP